MRGLYFEEMEEGAQFWHPFTRTVTEMDNVLFTSLTMNVAPIHLDEEYARAHLPQGRRLVNSLFTAALIGGMIVPDLTFRTTIGNLGYEKMTFPNPVFHGDTLRAESTILRKRESKTRPDAGIVWFEHRGYNQHDELVHLCHRAGMIMKKPAREGQIDAIHTHLFWLDYGDRNGAVERIPVTEHPPHPAAAQGGGPVPDVDAVVIGAGFAGLYALHRLRGMGLSARAFEQAEDVGGTWYWNRYPGARCDVESLDYSFSFSEELQQEWSWTERYATQPEILRYLNHVADRFDLRPGITFGTRVVSAVYDEPSAQWLIETDRGHRVTARYCIMAVGNLSVGRIPEFPGRESFCGQAYHTGAWPREDVDVAGLRVGVIGTGSSGIQVIPLLAEQAAHLTVFQRTAHYTIPAQHHRLDPDWLAGFKRQYADYRRRMRVSRGGQSRDYSERRAQETTPQQRRKVYEARWNFGGAEILGSFADLLTDTRANQTVAEFVHGKIRDIVRDPDVAGQLIPRGYPFGAKRLCVDTGYYETYNRDNVTLVDVAATPVEAVTPAGIRTSAREYELDAIVFATGFDAMTGALLAMDIRGRHGLTLREAWAAGPRTYLGVSVAGFPNLFIITGPGSPSVLSNVVLSIEQHVEWISDFLGHLRKHDLDWAEPRTEAQSGWVAHVNDVASRTLFPVGNSWYLGANVPGKPRVFMPYIGGVGRYRAICDRVAGAGYAGFGLGTAGQGLAPAPDDAALLARILRATEGAAVADAEGAWG